MLLTLSLSLSLSLSSSLSGRLIVEYACETEGCVVLAGGLMRLLERKDEQGASRGSLRPSHAGLVPHVMISG